MAFTYNHDVRGLHSRINRFIKELYHSQSSGVSLNIEADQIRLQTYLDAMTSYHAWVVAQPALDLPETNPTQHEFDEDPVLGTIENESIRDAIIMLEIARNELVHSQSARLKSSFLEFDTNRFLAMVNKLQNFLDNYIKVTTPLDLPESSPMREQSGPGRLGV